MKIKLLGEGLDNPGGFFPDVSIIDTGAWVETVKMAINMLVPCPGFCLRTCRVSYAGTVLLLTSRSLSGLYGARSKRASRAMVSGLHGRISDL